MSNLTEKSLFFLVLFIVCNPTLSDRRSECISSVYEVFDEGKNSSDHFVFAMFSLSEKLITSKKNTQQYMRYYEDNAEAITQFENYTQEYENYNKDKNTVVLRHEETLLYFRSLIQWHRSRRLKRNRLRETKSTFTTSTAPSNTSVESKQQYILGFFRSLIIEDKDFQMLIATSVMPPQIYCQKFDDIELLCKEALYKMLGMKERDHKKEMNISYDIFVHCYKTYNYLDFTMANFFSESSSSTAQEEYNKKKQLSVMAAYLGHLADVATEIVENYKDYFVFTFPTVENYCGSGGSST